MSILSSLIEKLETRTKIFLNINILPDKIPLINVNILPDKIPLINDKIKLENLQGHKVTASRL